MKSLRDNGESAGGFFFRAGPVSGLQNFDSVSAIHPARRDVPALVHRFGRFGCYGRLRLLYDHVRVAKSVSNQESAATEVIETRLMMTSA